MSDIQKEISSSRIRELYITGTMTNIGSGALLALYGWGLGLEKYVIVSIGVQMLVFVCHGYPFRSEKYYDLSGSITHFADVLTSMISTE